MRLNYLAKIMAMEKYKLARTVVLMKPDVPGPGLGRVQHWWTVTNELVARHKDLTTALGLLKQSSTRNQGVVPSGIEPTVLDFDYLPIESWRRAVRRWAFSYTRTSFVSNRNMPTIKLMQRAIEKDERRMPRFPLTRRAC